MSDEPPIQPENDEPASEDGVPEDLVVPVELVDFSGEGIEPIEIQAEKSTLCGPEYSSLSPCDHGR